MLQHSCRAIGERAVALCRSSCTTVARRLASMSTKGLIAAKSFHVIACCIRNRILHIPAEFPRRSRGQDRARMQLLHRQIPFRPILWRHVGVCGRRNIFTQLRGVFAEFHPHVARVIRGFSTFRIRQIIVNPFGARRPIPRHWTSRLHPRTLDLQTSSQDLGPSDYLRNPCGTYAEPLGNPCGTSAEPLRNPCGTCGTSAEPIIPK